MLRLVAGSEFKQILLFAVDQILPGSTPNDFTQLDPHQDFLREVMRYDDAQVRAFRTQTETFFRDTLGLDFTNAAADANNIKAIPGAMLAPFRFNPLARYRVALHSNVDRLSENNAVRDGGFFVQITGTGVTYHGTFGGETGKSAGPGELLPFGFYNIVNLDTKTGQPEEEADPIVIQYRALSPVQKAPGGDLVLHCGLEHGAWGDGEMRGVQVIAPADSSHLRVVKRSVLTFPRSLAS